VNTNKLTKENAREEAVKAAVNSPELSDIKFTLGEKEFKVIDLSYDDYLKFITHLTPMLEIFIGSLASVGGVNVMTPNTEVNAASIIKYAGSSLPELVCIVCNQTDETITKEEVKKLAKSPFQLCSIVLQQIEKNKIISDFASFFKSVLPLIQASLTR
jgi:hypothetical protein